MIVRLLSVPLRRNSFFLLGALLALAVLPVARAVTLTAGDVVVADAGVSAVTSGIIQVAAATGNRTFVTGNGVGSGAAIDTPKFPLCSPAGTIYYFETGGTNANKLIGVNPADGVRTIISGTGVGTGTDFTGAANITGICWDPSTSTILISDIGPSAAAACIIRVDPTTGNRTVITGNGTGSGVALDTPKFVACSTTGTIYYYETAASGTANFVISVTAGVRAKASGSGTGTGANFVSITGMSWDAGTSKVMVSDAGSSASTSGLIRIDPANGNRVFLTGNSTGSGVAIDTPNYPVVASSGTAYYYETLASGTSAGVISVNGSTGARTILSRTGTGTGTNFASVTGMSVVPAPPPVINSTLTASATYRTAASTYTITASNTPTSYNATNLPPGLSINTSTGAITGTPTSRAGSPYSVTINATNAGGTGTATLVYTINQKALTISGTAANATVYNGTTTASLDTTSSALVGVDAADSGNVVLGFASAVGTYADRNVGTAKAITVTGFSISGTAASSYSLTQPTGLTANVTAKPLTVSGVTATATRIYDGTTVAGLAGTAAFLSTETAGTGTTSDGKPYSVDTIAIGGTAAGAFADRNVGTAKAITVTGITVTGTNASNYSVTQPTGLTANVTTKAITVSGLTTTVTRVYDGTTSNILGGTAAFQTGETAGTGTTSDGKPYSLDTIAIGGTATGTFATRNVGTAKSVTVSGVTVTGTDSANYSVTQPTGLTANITSKPLTVAGVTAVSTRVYNGTTAATLGGTAALLSTQAAGTGTAVDGKPYSVDSVTVGGTGAGTFASRNVGTAKAITVTGFTVTGTGSGNYSATQPTGLTADVTKKPLTVAGLSAVATRVYDGTTDAALSGTAAFLTTETAGTGTTSDGKPYSLDSVSVNGTAAGAFADRNVGTAKAITVTGLSVTGTGNGNYSATQPTGLTADVTAKALTVSGLTAAVSTRVYDGTTAVGVSGTAALQAGETAGTGTTSDGTPYTVDTVSVTGTAEGVFADRHVGTAKAIAISGLSLAGADSANYSVAVTGSLTADITPKALDISGVAAVATRMYDGTTVAGLSGTAAFLSAEAAGAGTTVDGKPYSVDTISVGGTAEGAFADRNVGTAKAITVSGISVAGTDAANYTATQPTGLTADVTAKALSIAGLSAVASRTYDGTTVAGLTGTAAFLSAEAAGAGTTVDGIPYSVDTISVGGTAAGAFGTRTVGVAKTITVTGITVTGTDAANYTATQPTGLNGDITPKALGIAGLSSAASRTYDGTTVASLTGTAAFLSAEAAGAGTTVDGKPYSVDTISVTGTAAGAFGTRTVGVAKNITVTGLGVGGTHSANYTAIQPTGLNGDITPKALTVAGVTAVATRVYDGTTVAGLGGAAAFLSAEAAGAGTTVDGKPYSVDTISIGGTAAGAFADRNAGTAKAITVSGLTVTGTNNANYSITQPTGLTADVTAKELTVAGLAAAVASRVYDGTTVIGISGTAALLSGEAAGAGTTTDGKPYTVDTISVTGTATGAFADRNAGTAKAIAISGLSLAGADSANYSVAVTGSLTADITPKALDISGVTTVATRVYDGTTVAGLTGTPAFAPAETTGTGTTSDGIPYTVDSVSVGGTAAGAFADRNVGTAKAITVTGLTVAGTGASNYTATQPTGLTADVTAKALNIAGVSAVATRVYDGTTVAGLSGTAAFLSSEAAGAGTTSDGKPYSVDTISMGGTAAGAFADRNVGTAKAITVTGLTVSGTDSANYTTTQPTGLTADVTAKSLSIAGLSGVASRTYNGTTVAGLTGSAAFLSSEAAGAGTTSDGKPYSVDTISVSGTAAGAFANRNVGTGKAITVTGLGVGGTDSGNYSAVQPTGLTGNVTAKALTIAGVTGSDKIYDATTTATLGGTAAFLSSEAAGAGTTSDGKPYSVDTITVSGTAAGTFADKDVASGKAITVTGIAVTGTDSSNYSVALPTGLTAAITKKTLTISGVTASNKIYDGTTSATLSGTPTFQSAEAPGAGTTSDGKPYTGDTFDAAGGTLTGTFDTKDASTGKTITMAGVTLSGAQAGNYDVSALTATADITPKALTISGLAAVATRIYDGTTAAGLTGTPAFSTAEATGTGTTADGVPYTVDSVTVGGTAAGAFADRNVATAKAITVTGLTVAGTGAANYTTTQPTGLTADVTAKALNIAGVTAGAPRIYDGTTVAGLSGTAAFLSSEAAGVGTTSDGKPYSVDTINASGTAAGAFANRHVGTTKAITVTGLTVAGTDSGNYSVIQPTGLTGDVTAKALTIAGVTASDKIYDATLGAPLGGAAAFLAAEAAGSGTTSDGKPYSVDTISVGGTATGTFADKDVATGKAVTVSGLTVGGTDGANYTAAQPVGLTAAVTKKTLTVSGVTVANKIYDGTTLVTLSGTPALQPAETPGTGTTSDGKPYTGDTFTAGGTLTGTFDTRDAATGKTITVAGVTLSGAQADNYDVSALTATADITPKALTVSGLAAVATRIYDGTTVAGVTGAPVLATAEATGTGTTTDGIPYTVDSVTAGGTVTGAFADRHVSTAKAVTVTGLTVTGTGSGNYIATPPSGLTAAVTAKALNIVGITAVPTRVYDGTTVAGLGGTAAFLASEAAGAGTTSDGKPYSVDTIAISGTPAGAFATNAVGSAKAITVTGLTATGTDSGNYTVIQPTGLTADVTPVIPIIPVVPVVPSTPPPSITPIRVSIAISNLSHTYDGTPKSATVTISPNVSASISYSNGSSAPTNAGSYTVTVNVTNPSYSGSAEAMLTIAKATQTLAFTIAGGDFKVGSTLRLNATANSGLPVTFAVLSGSTSLSGSGVTITQPGEVTIRATQAGNENYLAATADQSFTCISTAQTAQTITFAAMPNVAMDAGNIALSATASSGLPVSFTVLSGPAILVGNRLVLSGATGLVTVQASQAGNATFAAAPNVVRAFTITPAVPDIFFGDLVDDSGISSRGEQIQSTGHTLESKSGDVAAAIFAGTNRGTVLIVSPSLSLNLLVNFTVNADGTFVAPFTSAGRSLTLTGRYGGGLLTGQLATLRVGFTTTVQPRAGMTANLAGIYESNSINSATGGAASIVGPDAQILVVANTGTLTAGAAGTVNADGTFNLAGSGSTISGAVDAPTTSVAGMITVGNQTPVSFTGISAAATRTDRLINLSSRVRVAPNRILITGFVVGGTDPKRILIRGVGPALAGFGVQGALANPRLQLFDATGRMILENDDWSEVDTSATFARVGAFSLPAGSKDAALLTTLAPGAYTVQITAGDETGVALAEIYDASTNADAETQRLVNISTRGTVDAGSDGLLIGGFVVTGNTPKKVLIRGVGPGLGAFGVPGTLVDPRLTVYNGSTMIAQNDDWSTSLPLNTEQSAATASELAAAAQSVGAFALGANTKDAALIITLAPGAYTAQVSGTNGSTGAAIVEIYELPH